MGSLLPAFSLPRLNDAHAGTFKSLRMSDTPSKVNTDLKDAIEKTDNIEKLKDVTTTQGTGAGFAMSMYGIEHFNKDKLSKTETNEKNVLPDAATIQQEKEAVSA